MKWGKALTSPNLIIPNTPGISAGDSIGSVHPCFLLQPLLHLGTLQHSIKSQPVHHTYRVEDQDQERLTCSIHENTFVNFIFLSNADPIIAWTCPGPLMTKVTDALEIWLMWLWLIQIPSQLLLTLLQILKMMSRNVVAIAFRDSWQLSTLGVVVPMAMFLLHVHLMAITFAMDLRENR